MMLLESVSFAYTDDAEVTDAVNAADVLTLRNISVHVDEAEMVLLAGRTGTGKSTLLRAMTGLVPHFTGGTLSGDVSIDGLSTREHQPRDLAHLVGFVGQDPSAGFVTDTVEDELAYGMEQLGIAPRVMRRRVEETLDLLGIAELRNRPLRTLSGGQQQRIAIGSVLTMHPTYLVLDEPTSALDPTAAEDVLATLSRLVGDLGTTVILAEHRMERVIPFADRMLYLDGGTLTADASPAEVLADTAIAPPIIELGRVARWHPLPVSTREARRPGRELRQRLQSAATEPAAPSTNGDDWPDQLLPDRLLSARDISVQYGHKAAVRSVDIDLHAGKAVVVMGRNGSGKSSLLWALQGSGPRASGDVTVGGYDPGSLSPARARSLVGLVPQTASDLLYLDSVHAECDMAERQAGVRQGQCWHLLNDLAPGIAADRHPRDLSEGQRLALVLAVQLTAAPHVMLLDEPTRGLDYIAKAQLVRIVRSLAAQGTAVALATHDVEFAAHVADRVIVMAQGSIVSDGPTREVLAESPAFAPQVAKVLGSEWLTVDDVAATLQAVRP